MELLYKFCKYCSVSYNLVKQIGCYGDESTRAFSLSTSFSWASTTTEMLENVRRCRDEVKQKVGLAAGYKVCLIPASILSQT